MIDHMPCDEIKKRLHKFNLTDDWSVFNDVPDEQAIDVMYPHVLTFDSALTTEENSVRRKEVLNELFGPLK